MPPSIYPSVLWVCLRPANFIVHHYLQFDGRGGTNNKIEKTAKLARPDCKKVETTVERKKGKTESKVEDG